MQNESDRIFYFLQLPPIAIVTDKYTMTKTSIYTGTSTSFILTSK